VDTGPSLTPEELPLRGETVLPHIGQPPPDIHITPQGDNRGKSATMALSEAPYTHTIDHQALRTYIESLSEILEQSFVTVFVQVDSSGAFYHYGYRALQFHEDVVEAASGKRELFFYLQPNRDNDDVWRMNVALLPRTPGAFDGYRRWLVPDYYQGRQASSCGVAPKKGHSAVQSGSGFICFEWSHLACVGGPGVQEQCNRYHYVSCHPADHNELDNSDHAGSGISDPCWTCDGDPTDVGNGGMPIPTGCDGDPNAFTDDCGRCVGGNTGRDPATDGMDCDKICDYDSSFLNRMDVQAEIHRMWNASFGPNNSPLPHDQRNESVVFLEYYRGEGESYRVIEPESVSSCHIHVGNPFDGKNNKRDAVRAILHTHPFSDQFKVVGM